jgi:hypothetical protein
VLLARNLRLHHHHAHVMSDDVVQFAGDPQALLNDRLLCQFEPRGSEALRLCGQPLPINAPLPGRIPKQPDANDNNERRHEQLEPVVWLAGEHIRHEHHGAHGHSGEDRAPSRLACSNRVERQDWTEEVHVRPVVVPGLVQGHRQDDDAEDLQRPAASCHEGQR